MLQKILVAVDGSEYSKKALDFACELAAKFNASLHIVHVPQGAAADRVMVLGGASVMDAASKIAEEKLPGNVTTALRGGDPAAEIVASAKEYEADCIVIGSRGLGDFGGLLLGSVSHKVNHSAPCTCITVH
jgi:nucleotide-binding universal stress UspA family protein